MRWSHMLIPTLREVPKDAEATSHKLMLRAGLIRKLMAGVYSYLPLGYRVLKKIIGIIQEEMDAVGAQELLLPAIHPVDIWQRTGRYDVMQDILMTVRKEGKQEIVLGPTHEEIITELAAAYIASYKDLPKSLYQIQTKFRDEARPRFGIIRSKEFIMKDAYSFDDSFAALDKSYVTMYDAYKRIFDRCGLEYAIVSADAGDMGGDVSHEFMVKLPFGEDFVVSCSDCDLSASIEVAQCGAPPAGTEDAPVKESEEFDTPGIKTIDDLSATYSIDPRILIKTIIYQCDDTPVACLVRGDCDICEAKLKKALGGTTLVLANESVIRDVTGAPVGFAGPVGLKKKTRIIGDLSVKGIVNAVTGANKKDAHIRNVNAGRDYTCDEYYDIRYIRDGDSCPVCAKGSVSLDRSLEIGHVFKLGTKYSQALHATFLDKNGKEKEIVMGCYGIGVNRIMAACIELHNDEKGIQWPLSIAPFTVGIVPINVKHDKTMEYAESLYARLQQKGIDTIFDDRNARAGVKFNDIELIGIPLVVVVGERNLKNNCVEIKVRSSGETEIVSTDETLARITTLLSRNT